MLFNFPFKPYPQQEELMIAIENCIAQRHSGCFESPTGTGKSLSAICSTLHWLLGEEKRIFSEMDMKVVKVESDDWLSEITSDKLNDNISEKMLQTKDNYKSMTARIASSKADMLMGNKRKRNTPSNFMNHSTSTLTHDTSSQNEFLLPDYDSSEEFGEDVEKEHCDPDDIDALDLPQILYCSRTHSQLAQFVAEVKKTAYKDIRCVILGSRKSLCINQGVVNSSGETELNEKCLEMQKNKDKNKNTKNNEKDPALPSSSACCGFHSKEGERQLSDLSLSQVTDLEDILSIAIAAGPAEEAILSPRKVSFNMLSKPACPYYASRLGVKKAQLVCMPYNMLLQTELRQSLGLSLKNKVVVVDEAHNLVEAINQMHSATVSSAQLEVALQAVSQYVSRFSSVLSGKNSYNLKVLMAVIKKLIAKAPRMAATSGTTTVLSAVSAASTVTTAAAGAPGGGGNNSVSAIAGINANTGTANTAAQSNGQSGTVEPMSAVRSVNDFLFSATLDNINMLKLAKFIGANRLIEKVSGHYVHHCSSAAIATEVQSKAQSSVPPASHTTQRTSTQPNHPPTTVPTQGYVVSALRIILNLLRCFVNVDSDGRVVFRSNPAPTFGPANNSINNNNNNSSTNTACKDFTLSYLMLNPATHFQPILAEARSVVLLGGTLQPFDHLVSSLFPVPVQTDPQTAPLTALQVTSQHSLDTNSGNAPNKSSSTGLDNSSLRLFACGHVVPPSHVKSLVVTAGPSGSEMQFTAEKRMSVSIVNDLHAVLVQIASTVPGGVVVFFTSYAYMDMVLARWRANNGHLMGAIERHKAVFVETKDKSKKEKGSGGVCNAWNAYCAEVVRATRRGAMLFTVIGGSLSEGINFSDDLARCVVVVGMPYPDHRDPVFKEKMSFAEKSQRIPGGGSRLLDSVCMNSVNQTIGRSIRHAGDFASIVLLDKRYAQARIQKQLPGWIGREIECCAVTPVQSSGSTVTGVTSSSNTVNSNNIGIGGSSGGSRSLTTCLSEFFALHNINKDE